MAQAKQDMGSGSVKKLMLQLMIPAVVAQVVNLLYNIVDRIYIARIPDIGTAALGVIAAVCAISQSKKVAKRKAAEQAA